MNRSKKIRTLAALGTLSGAVWAGTFASFTDDASSAATFSAGTVDLVVGGDADDAHDFADLKVEKMKPRDVRYAALTVHNAGDLPLGYTMKATTAPLTAGATNLGLALDLQVKPVAAAADCKAGTFPIGASLSTPLALSGAAIASRTVAVGATEVLCFEVAFRDAGAAIDNTYQGTSTTATLSFTATQS